MILEEGVRAALTVVIYAKRATHWNASLARRPFYCNLTNLAKPSAQRVMPLTSARLFVRKYRKPQ